MRTPLLVGVDVHQQQNVMSFLDMHGQAARDALSVENNRPGTEAFVQELTQVLASGGFDGIRIAAEATGWYWFHFFQLLSQHAALTAWPLELYPFNPRLSAKYKESMGDLDKTDALDALVAADWLRTRRNLPERFTAEGARRAVKELTSLAPQTARVERSGSEVERPIADVHIGDMVVVRPGELISVDGEVVSGHATINQATITGESVPVDAGPGAQVFAATIAQLGSLRVRTVRVGPDTTFGRVVKMVEEAEAHRSDVQRFADKFTGYYLPIVAGIALLTYLISRDPLSTAAVLVVACSCSIALMRNDWQLVPEFFQIARRTMGVVKMNLIFTAIYNVVGLSLAAFGYLPPMLAAAAQSIPDLGILANSARLLRTKTP